VQVRVYSLPPKLKVTSTVGVSVRVTLVDVAVNGPTVMGFGGAVIDRLDDGLLGAASSKGRSCAGNEDGDAPEASTPTDHVPDTELTEDAV
jgi:hypothetical protein